MPRGASFWADAHRRGAERTCATCARTARLGTTCWRRIARARSHLARTTSLSRPRAWRQRKGLLSLPRSRQLQALQASREPRNQPARAKQWWACHSQVRSARPRRQKCFRGREKTYEPGKPGTELRVLQARAAARASRRSGDEPKRNRASPFTPKVAAGRRPTPISRWRMRPA
jgi:hypothetical protein